MAKQRVPPHEGLAVPRRAHSRFYRRPFVLIVRSRYSPAPPDVVATVRSTVGGAGEPSCIKERKVKHLAFSGVKRDAAPRPHRINGAAADARDCLLPWDGKSGSPRPTGPAAHATTLNAVSVRRAVRWQRQPTLTWIGRSCPRGPAPEPPPPGKPTHGKQEQPRNLLPHLHSHLGPRPIPPSPALHLFSLQHLHQLPPPPQRLHGSQSSHTDRPTDPGALSFFFSLSIADCRPF
ncbi:hypothetical protein TPAR_06014 [Tolypocladium paradoxum]|uniref:Uncharacterized protein n=1 Tax=Tolypocladium paradoxum TaxID=94208 RepID=A0A2S4KUA9_9HYPO|nr:hypothetical protein TPAR_06014 [Tolypocladium paradoxum]